MLRFFAIKRFGSYAKLKVVERVFKTKDAESLKWKNLENRSWSDCLNSYCQLSKLKLSSFVIASTAFGYLLAPSAPDIYTDSILFVNSVVGTSLCVCSANALNQFMEATFDAQMKRTFNRVLPTYKISLLHSFVFGIVVGSIGSAILYINVNNTTGHLGLINICLYAFVYTPLKRLTILNTWIGAIVGAIPPIMGWTSRSNGDLSLPPVILGSLLFAWQFPHFNSLSWNIRSQYAKAGYHMMSVYTPRLNSASALGFSLLIIPLTFACSSDHCKLTSSWFSLTGSLITLPLIFYSAQFHMRNDVKNARKLFKCTLLHLPIYMLIMLMHKTKEPKCTAKILQ